MTLASPPIFGEVSLVPLTRLAHVLDLLPCGVTVADASIAGMPLVYVNRRFCEMTGYAEPELLGKPASFLQGPKQGQHGATVARMLLKEGKCGQTLLQNFRKDGTPFHNKLTLSPMPDETGRISHWLGVQEDISDQLELVRELAPVDMLTGLPHRGALLDHLEQLLRAGARQDTPELFHVMLLDLDNFSVVNAEYGFAVGDACLQEAAERLRAIAPAGSMIGRMGGVQFLCIYQPLDASASVEELGLAFINSMKQPQDLHHAVKLVLSVGISTYPFDGPDAETLVQHAKVAMHHARASGLDYPLPWVSMLT